MRSTILDQEQNQLILTENGQGGFQKPQNQHQKPFMAAAIHKTVPIGYQYHQIEVPDFIPLPISSLRQEVAVPRSPPVYLRTQIQEDQLQQYLSFVEGYYQQKIPDYFAQDGIFPSWKSSESIKDDFRFISSLFLISGIISRDRTRSQAMELLHQMKYNYTKAKFYLIFPYYLAYNRHRCHDPLNLKDSEMTRKISEHLQGLKNTKQKQLQRWVGSVQNSIQSRIHLNKLNTLIQVAKQNKFQIPEAIREHIQRSIKTGRQIKKTLHNTRLPLDKLILKKQSLQQCKIITNEMIQFEETVTRCEEWLKKQKNFQETFFTFGPEPILKQLSSKIQFRTLQLLVNEFNNLPLIYDNFQKTTGVLYNNTMALLQRLPPLNKAAKTRTAQSSSVGSKVSIECAREYLQKIQKCPVEHEDFTSFENTIRQHLQWLQRIGLWLEDEKAQKSIKLIQQYAKIINDIPISNKVQIKLQSRLQYYEIMQRVKKDISNPAKYQQIKDAIKKLKQKGYETFQYVKLQSRIVSYMEWYQSQQMINQNRLPATKIELLTNKKNIKMRMIPQQAFRLQLISAKQQLNIPQQVWMQSQGKVHLVQSLRGTIRQLLTQQNPNINQIIDIVSTNIKNGLLFEQFEILYDRMIEIYFVLAKMQFMLMAAQQTPEEGEQYFFNSEDLEYVFGIMNSQIGFQVKSLQSKQAGDEVQRQTRNKGFPKHLVAYRMFQNFMHRAEVWSIKAQQMIKTFKEEKGNDVNIRELIEESKNCLHSKSVEEELNRIDIVLKWREKIIKKLSEYRESPFVNEDHRFFQRLQRDLQQAERNNDNSEKTKIKALEYLTKSGKKFQQILQKVSNIQIECTYKLSQMNKFCKEVDRQIQRYRLDDRIILNLKDELQKQLLLSDQWKEKYLAIKRYQRKKAKKDEEDEQEKKIQGDTQEKNTLKILQQTAGNEGVQFIPYVPCISNVVVQGKRKYFIRNGQFCWFYKLPLMIFQFYNGFNLKFAIEELVRLRATLTDIYRFICHFNSVHSRVTKSDQQLSALQAEASKFPLFFRETYLISKKIGYVNSWKEIANSIIKTVPILSMELKARRPQQLLQLLEIKKNQKDDGKQQGRVEQLGSKRKRKQNPFYSNEDMTLITEQTFGLKTKKKRKGNNDSEYRNTAVASSAKKLARNQRQQIQRAEALLSGQVPAQLIQIDDPKQYCICRFGVPNENSVMVQCQYKCEEWFHIECLGIKKHQTKNDMKLRCVGCRALYNEQSMGHFIWDTYAKITQYALQQIVDEGRYLCVETSEIKKLEVLSTKMNQWKSAVKDMLKKVCETNGEDLPALEPPLYQLFLQSIWFPSAHPQAAILRKLVLMARNEL